MGLSATILALMLVLTVVVLFATYLLERDSRNASEFQQLTQSPPE